MCQLIIKGFQTWQLIHPFLKKMSFVHSCQVPLEEVDYMDQNYGQNFMRTIIQRKFL